MNRNEFQSAFSEFQKKFDEAVKAMSQSDQNAVAEQLYVNVYSNPEGDKSGWTLVRGSRIVGFPTIDAMYETIMKLGETIPTGKIRFQAYPFGGNTTAKGGQVIYSKTITWTGGVYHDEDGNTVIVKEQSDKNGAPAATVIGMDGQSVNAMMASSLKVIYEMVREMLIDKKETMRAFTEREQAMLRREELMQETMMNIIRLEAEESRQSREYANARLAEAMDLDITNRAESRRIEEERIDLEEQFRIADQMLEEAEDSERDELFYSLLRSDKIGGFVADMLGMKFGLEDSRKKFAEEAKRGALPAAAPKKLADSGAGQAVYTESELVRLAMKLDLTPEQQATIAREINAKKGS